MSEGDKHLELAVQISRDALKSLLLVNGGAATALIALMEKSGRDYTSAVMWFAAGTVGAVISICFGYFSQLHYANHRLNSASYSKVWHDRWQIAAIASVLATLGLMVTGMIVAANVVRA